MFLNEIDGEYIVAATGRRSRTFGGYICLNHTGKIFVGHHFKRHRKRYALQKFAEEFGIDYTTAKDDADAFLSKLEGADIIER
ncbi:MAG: PqqD family protein [Clostridiales bacterium]|nr:MAG: PqqD family protein [Clostridiales bacterium]